MRGVLSFIALLALSGSVPAAEDSPGDSSQWRHIAMAQALKSIDGVADPYRLSLALTGAARAQLFIADDDGAEASLRRSLAVTQRIAEADFKGWALNEIVLAQIEGDDFIGARETAARIVAPRPQSTALAAIADVELRGGKLSNAQATVAKIRDERTAGEVSRRIAAQQLKTGSLAAARATALSIDDRFFGALALGDVAVAEVRAGTVERALQTASRAHKSQRASVEGRVAIARAQAGDVGGALASLGRIDDVLFRALVQAQIAGLRAAAGDAGASREMFAAAVDSLEDVREQKHRLAVTLSQIARLQADAGERAYALVTLQKAIAAVTFDSERQRDDALDMIARSQLRLGDFQAALATGLQIENRISRALLVRDVVAIQVRTGNALATVRGAAPSLDALAEAAALFGVLGNQLALRDRAGAAETITLARAALRSIDPELQPAAYASLAAARVTLQDAAGGWEIFQQAMAAAAAIEPQDQRAAAYISVVTALDHRLMFLGQPPP